MKERTDLLLKLNQKLQKCRQNLEALHLAHGNSVERQKGKEEMELLLSDIDRLFDFFSQHILNFLPGDLRSPAHLSKVNDHTENCFLQKILFSPFGIYAKGHYLE